MSMEIYQRERCAVCKILNVVMGGRGLTKGGEKQGRIGGDKFFIAKKSFRTEIKYQIELIAFGVSRAAISL